MAASALTITAAREEVVDFTIPFWEEASSVIVRRTTEETGYL